MLLTLGSYHCSLLLPLNVQQNAEQLQHPHSVYATADSTKLTEAVAALLSTDIICVCSAFADSSPIGV